RFVWNSRMGGVSTLKPRILEARPEWVGVLPPATPKLDPKVLDVLIKAADGLANDMPKGEKYQAGLTNILTKPTFGKSEIPLVKQLIAVRSLAALDEDPNNLTWLVNALEDEPNVQVRLYAIDALRYWLAQDRDNDYRLLEMLNTRYLRGGE